jgi:hypothetical protein
MVVTAPPIVGVLFLLFGGVEFLELLGFCREGLWGVGARGCYVCLGVGEILIAWIDALLMDVKSMGL